MARVHRYSQYWVPPGSLFLLVWLGWLFSRQDDKDARQGLVNLFFGAQEALSRWKGLAPAKVTGQQGRRGQANSRGVTRASAGRVNE